jgi:hypothetical protein
MKFLMINIVSATSGAGFSVAASTMILSRKALSPGAFYSCSTI